MTEPSWLAGPSPYDGTVQLAEPRALVVIPVPCDARLFFRIVTEVARVWEREHRGKTMPTTHMQMRRTEFGDAVVVWDAPVSDTGAGGG